MKNQISMHQIKRMSKEEFAEAILGKCEQAKKYILLSNFDPATGTCEMVPMETLRENGLQFGNGANWARDGSKLGTMFFVERHKEKGAIVGVSLKGYRPKRKVDNSRHIPQEVKNYFRSLPRHLKRCAWCGRPETKRKQEIDHRCGRYNDPEYDSRDPAFYQLLCKNCNDWKRSFCTKCEKAGKRFDARKIFVGEKLGWHCGGATYEGTCYGCILHGFKQWRSDHFRHNFDAISLLAAQGAVENPDEDDEVVCGEEEVVREAYVGSETT